MIDDMGIFRTSIEVAAHARPEDRRRIDDVMVDTGSEFNWVPRDILEELGVAPVYVEQFETADGRVIEREVGYAILFVAGRQTGTTVAFADPGDKILLGAIGLEGLNVRVDLARKQLVPAGPVSVASAA